jgi:hypothetical protein
MASVQAKGKEKKKTVPSKEKKVSSRKKRVIVPPKKIIKAEEIALSSFGNSLPSHASRGEKHHCICCRGYEECPNSNPRLYLYCPSFRRIFYRPTMAKYQERQGKHGIK